MQEELEEMVLTKELAGESLSLLAKTGSGIAHAYVRMDLRNKCTDRSRDNHVTDHTPLYRKLTDISILECYVHVRYLDISSNRLSDISALNSLPQLLSVRADQNNISSLNLKEVGWGYHPHLLTCSLCVCVCVSVCVCVCVCADAVSSGAEFVSKSTDIHFRHCPSFTGDPQSLM